MSSAISVSGREDMSMLVGHKKGISRGHGYL